MPSNSNRPVSSAFKTKRRQRNPKSQQVTINPRQFTQTPLSLKTLCILNLSDDDTAVLATYHDEFREDLKKKLWQEVSKYPEPLAYRISDRWII